MGTRTRRMALGAVLSLGLVGMIPAVAFAAQPVCGQSITSNTTLTANLDCSGFGGNGLIFGANGIVLDLNGHTITGWTGDDSYYGVYTNGYNHVVVKNGTIRGFEINVYSYYTSNSKFKKLSLIGEAADPYDSGVYSYYGAGNVYNKLTTSDVYYGMDMYGGASHQVLNSTFTSDTYGVYSEYESGDLFKGNVTHSAQYGFYDDYSGNNRYVGNTANGGSSDGFYMDCSDYGRVTLINNIANDNGGYGFYLYYCKEENTTQMLGSWVSGNTAKRNGSDGFYAEYSDNSTFQYNIAKRNGGDGFYDYYNIGSTWMYNTSTRNDDEGFEMQYPTNYVVKYNIANYNGGDGFYLYENYSTSYYNLKSFSNNSANNNDSWGHYADYGAPGKGNTASGNGSGKCYNVVCK